MIKLRKAVMSDAETIRQINIKAFNDENLKVLGRIGGPPGYDDIEEQQHLIENYLVHLIMEEGVVVGSCFLDRQAEDVYRVENYAILPEYQGNGYGYRAMLELEKEYPNVKTWTLGALKVSPRSQNLYKKMGYVIISEDEYVYEFEKRIR